MRHSPVNFAPAASPTTTAWAPTSMWLANSGGGSASASSVNTSLSRRKLAVTSWNAHATLRDASRYSTRLSRTSTSMSGGTCTVACSPLIAGAPCKR